MPHINSTVDHPEGQESTNQIEITSTHIQAITRELPGEKRKTSQERKNNNKPPNRTQKTKPSNNKGGNKQPIHNKTRKPSNKDKPQITAPRLPGSIGREGRE